MTLAIQLVDRVQAVAEASRHIFPELYSTWDFLSGEDRICHHRTTALLAHAAWMLPSNAAVELGNSFTVGTEKTAGKTGKGKIIKWHPDMTLRGKGSKDRIGNVLLLVDFESSNSSDFRVIDRNMERWYVNWVKYGRGLTEYLIITSLPDGPCDWDCRYSESEGWDSQQASKSPFRFWYGIYKTRFKPKWREYPITFANFNGKRLSVVDVFRRSYTKPAATRR